MNSNSKCHSSWRRDEVEGADTDSVGCLRPVAIRWVASQCAAARCILWVWELSAWKWKIWSQKETLHKFSHHRTDLNLQVYSRFYPGTSRYDSPFFFLLYNLWVLCRRNSFSGSLRSNSWHIRNNPHHFSAQQYAEHNNNNCITKQCKIEWHILLPSIWFSPFTPSVLHEAYS